MAIRSKRPESRAQIGEMVLEVGVLWLWLQHPLTALQVATSISAQGRCLSTNEQVIKVSTAVLPHKLLSLETGTSRHMQHQVFYIHASTATPFQPRRKLRVLIAPKQDRFSWVQNAAAI